MSQKQRARQKESEELQRWDDIRKRIDWEIFQEISSQRYERFCSIYVESLIQIHFFVGKLVLKKIPPLATAVAPRCPASAAQRRT